MLGAGRGTQRLRAPYPLEHGALSHTDIARRLNLSGAPVTGLVDRLQDADYVERLAASVWPGRPEPCLVP